MIGERLVVSIGEQLIVGDAWRIGRRRSAASNRLKTGDPSNERNGRGCDAQSR